MFKKSNVDERQALLNDVNRTDDQEQSRSIHLEWAESSWTRFLHRFCWLWIYPMLSLSHKRQLTENDLDDAPYVDKSSLLLNRLDSYDWSTRTTSAIIIREFWKDYLSANFYMFPLLLLCIAQPLIFRQIILHIMDKQGSVHMTYLYAMIIFLTLILYTLTERQAIFGTIRVSTRIRNALIITIYKRLLSLKLASWQQMNTGKMINLIANDVSRFEEIYTWLSSLCKGIIECFILFGLLCWIIRPIPTLCTLILFSLLLLMQVYVSAKFRSYRERTTICRDLRTQAFSELINGCQTVKMYNWEKQMEDRIIRMRENELDNIRSISRLRAFVVTLFFISSSLLSLSVFGSIWLLNYPLNVANAFTVLLFFALIRNYYMYYSSFIGERLSEVTLASKRIDSFMHLTAQQERQSSSFTSSISRQQKGNIVIANASFSWHNEIPCLSSIDLIIEQGGFIGIVGPVGSGKSSLLTAILGELNLLNGQLNTSSSSFSYTDQSPWLIADTFRNNILLNRPFDGHHYRNVIHACCLDVDLRVFGSSGDLTMIGEMGVNLSGGQKARVTLARAIYGNADIYLFDDPLSAVDHRVAKQIYERCFSPRGLLKDKTRLLVTHQSAFLYETHQIIYLRDGRIVKQSHSNESTIHDEHDNHRTEKSVLSDLLDENTSTVEVHSLITDETSPEKDVSQSVLYKLFSAPPLGKLGFGLLIVLLLSCEITNDLANYYLSIYLKQSYINEKISFKSTYIYFGLIITTIITTIIFINYYFLVILNGSHHLHNGMLKGLLYTSIQFFESNPTGRILNRTSKDQYMIDESLPTYFLFGVIGLLLTIGSIIIICFLNPSLMVLLVALVPIVWSLIYFYQSSARELKRLENITRSPVYALFTASLGGSATIRALKAEDSFIQLMFSKIDANTSATINVVGASQWFAVRLSVLFSFIFLFVSIRIIVFQSHTDVSTIALSLMYAISAALPFQWAIRRLSEADIMMTSADRIDEYSRLPPEEDDTRLVRTSPTWPDDGTIEFRNYSLRHRVYLEPVLKNINLRIESGQTIGIIGRTGAGKSSLFKGLLRLIDRSCVQGELLINDVDISRLTLTDLRSSITIIPQQPVLFSGTLRDNLDPFNSYSDEQCWLALDDVQLRSFISNHPNALSRPIDESGHNLSVGQRQLICIARAILLKSKILLIDEATANVDQKTDALIQQVIQEKLRHRTILTIAHRLDTIEKCDRIIVLDNGVIINDDVPTRICSLYHSFDWKEDHLKTIK